MKTPTWTSHSLHILHKIQFWLNWRQTWTQQASKGSDQSGWWKLCVIWIHGQLWPFTHHSYQGGGLNTVSEPLCETLPLVTEELILRLHWLFNSESSAAVVTDVFTESVLCEEKAENEQLHPGVDFTSDLCHLRVWMLIVPFTLQTKVWLLVVL